MSRKTLRNAFVFAGLCFSLAGVNTAFAQLVAIPDRAELNTYASVSNNATLAVSVDPGSSYCCEVLRNTGTSLTFSSANVSVAASGGSTSTVTGRYAGSDSPRLLDTQARLCFTVPATTAAPTATLTLGTTSETPLTDVVIGCEETTLYGGFNTSVTDFNFLEMTNTLESVTTPVSNREIAGTLTAVNVVPNPDVVVINAESFTIPAGTRLDVDIHSRVGVGAFGTLRVTHNAAPGAVKAVLSQYNITTLSPLDFAPVAQEALRTRSDIAGPVR